MVGVILPSVLFISGDKQMSETNEISVDIAFAILTMVIMEKSMGEIDETMREDTYNDIQDELGCSEEVAKEKFEEARTKAVEALNVFGEAYDGVMDFNEIIGDEDGE